ncbi:hypothetical protein PGB90_003805 [Kerria lacca]
MFSTCSIVYDSRSLKYLYFEIVRTYDAIIFRIRNWKDRTKKIIHLSRSINILIHFNPFQSIMDTRLKKNYSYYGGRKSQRVR